MQVTAYKDSVTGELFESKRKYNQFLANRAKAEAEQARRAAERAEEDALRRKLALNVVDRASFVALASERYEYVLARQELKRKANPIKLVDFTVTEWELTSSSGKPFLQVRVEVRLSSDPSRVLRDAFPRVSPGEVLNPFEHYGGSDKTARPGGGVTYKALLRAPLSLLPKLAKEVVEYTVIEEQFAQHLKAIEADTEARQARDKELATLKAASKSAQEAMLAAQAAFYAALALVRERSDALAEAAAKAAPFAHRTKANKLRETTGLPAADSAEYREYTMASLRKGALEIATLGAPTNKAH